jgi:outer membrane receptor protein involved in Fe transport
LNYGATQPRFQVNATLASKPDMLFGYAGLQFEVINVFDSLTVENFNSGFSGTRFQQPRTYLLTATAHF